jgi:hypothetical protein
MLYLRPSSLVNNEELFHHCRHNKHERQEQEPTHSDRQECQQERHGYWALQVSKTAQTGNLGFDKIMAMYRCEVEIDSEPSAVMAIGTGFSHAH